MTAAAESSRSAAAKAPVSPCIPLGAACFPPDPEVEVGALIAELTGELHRLSQACRDDPLGSPVLLLGLGLARRLAEGRIGPSALEQLVQRLTAEGFADRATRLGHSLGEIDPAANAARLTALFEGLARPDADSAPDAPALAFEAFRAKVEREVFGIVITAHPTFNLSGGLMRDLGTLAAGRDADGRPLAEAARRHIVERAAVTEHSPDPDLTLSREHALSLEAIGNIELALRRVYEIVFEVARRFYPERWTELRPRLLTIATWVGYDLDGRSDIRWTDILH